MSKLSLNSRFTTSHMRAYSGDLKSLLSHSDERKCDFVSTKKLRGFLTKEKIITKDEFSLMGGDNGDSFFIFYRNLDRHIAEVNELKGEPYAYVPSDPVRMSENESGLVTSAYVMNRRRANPSGFYNEPTIPKDFDKGSFLNVQRIVQFKPNLLQKIAGGKIWDIKHGNRHLSLFLGDLRAKFYGETKEIPELALIGYGHGSPQGVYLRNTDYSTSRWAQKNMLPALKKILTNSAASEAILVSQELAKIELPDIYGEEHISRKRIRKSIAKEQNNTREAFRKKHYIPSLEAAAKELGRSQQVVKVLELI